MKMYDMLNINGQIIFVYHLESLCSAHIHTMGGFLWL